MGRGGRVDDTLPVYRTEVLDPSHYVEWREDKCGVGGVGRVGPGSVGVSWRRTGAGRVGEGPRTPPRRSRVSWGRRTVPPRFRDQGYARGPTPGERPGPRTPTPQGPGPPRRTYVRSPTRVPSRPSEGPSRIPDGRWASRPSRRPVTGPVGPGTPEVGPVVESPVLDPGRESGREATVVGVVVSILSVRRFSPPRRGSPVPRDPRNPKYVGKEVGVSRSTSGPGHSGL